MNDWDALDAILQKHKYTIINDYGVMINRVAPGFMFVDSPWPGYTIDKIGLVYLCNAASEFYDRLEIKNAGQLNEVKPEILLKLFHTGDVIVVCRTEEEETLEFQICDGQLVANIEDSDLIHVVNEELTTAEEFMRYTRQFFLDRKDESGKRN